MSGEASLLILGRVTRSISRVNAYRYLRSGLNVAVPSPETSVTSPLETKQLTSRSLRDPARTSQTRSIAASRMGAAIRRSTSLE